MNRMADVFGVLESLKAEGIIVDYAIAGAMAVLFYAEPLRTYDLDVFILLPGHTGGLITLTPLYEQLADRGYTADAEHILIHDVPVQFLPAYNNLAEEALRDAIMKEYDTGITARVLRPEHLVALAIQTGGRKRREHIARLLESPGFDTVWLEQILERHGLLDVWRKDWAHP